MIYAGNEPRQPEAEENVDGITSGDVSDGVVRMFLVHGGSSTRKKVRQRSAEGDERDGFTKDT